MKCIFLQKTNTKNIKLLCEVIDNKPNQSITLKPLRVMYSNTLNMPLDEFTVDLYLFAKHNNFYLHVGIDVDTKIILPKEKQKVFYL